MREDKCRFRLGMKGSDSTHSNSQTNYSGNASQQSVVYYSPSPRSGGVTAPPHRGVIWGGKIKHTCARTAMTDGYDTDDAAVGLCITICAARNKIMGIRGLYVDVGKVSSERFFVNFRNVALPVQGKVLAIQLPD